MAQKNRKLDEEYLPDGAGGDCPPAANNFERLGVTAARWLQRMAARRQPWSQAERGAGGAPADPPRVCPVCRGARYLTAHSEPGAYSSALAPCPRCLEPELARQARQEHGRWTHWAAIAGQTFETFGPFRSGPAGEVCRAAMLYAERPQGWFVLAGTSRREQNHLAAAIANAVRGREPNTIYMAAPHFLRMLQETLRQQAARRRSSRVEGGSGTPAAPEFPSYAAVMAAVRTAAILVLVDLDETPATPWAAERIYLVVNHRYNHRLPTVFTLTAPERIEPRVDSRMQDPQILYAGRVFGLDAPASPSRQRRLQRPPTADSPR